jgi:ribosomal protein S18 acetylase RimI-like enzyme
MAAGHPTESHWYLLWFGIDRELHGRGLGTHLMRKCLEIVDGSGYPAYQVMLGRPDQPGLSSL